MKVTPARSITTAPAEAAGSASSAALTRGTVAMSSSPAIATSAP